jgi:signal transduction histidine kinase
VAMQQSYARRGGITDTLDIRALVEDSLRMNEGAFSRHGVSLVRDFQEVPLITVDKHKVLQILVNVIRNAKYACDESKGAEKRVTVRVRAADGMVLLSVIDTGVGIAQENLERIFNHGFTTRKDGHGFGLHSSALAAKELGGMLRAESAGPGQGATFTLTLPLSSPEPPDGQ